MSNRKLRVSEISEEEYKNPTSSISLYLLGDKLFNVYLLKLTSYLKAKRLKLYPNSRKVLHSRVYSEFHGTYHIGYALYSYDISYFKAQNYQCYFHIT